jgi:hypothetical protein
VNPDPRLARTESKSHMLFLCGIERLVRSSVGSNDASNMFLNIIVEFLTIQSAGFCVRQGSSVASFSVGSRFRGFRCTKSISMYRISLIICVCHVLALQILSLKRLHHAAYRRSGQQERLQWRPVTKGRIDPGEARQKKNKVAAAVIMQYHSGPWVENAMCLQANVESRAGNGRKRSRKVRTNHIIGGAVLIIDDTGSRCTSRWTGLRL